MLLLEDLVGDGLLKILPNYYIQHLFGALFSGYLYIQYLYMKLLCARMTQILYLHWISDWTRYTKKESP